MLVQLYFSFLKTNISFIMRDISKVKMIVTLGEISKGAANKKDCR